jgi:protein-arginine kinase activator protein McsA
MWKSLKIVKVAIEARKNYKKEVTEEQKIRLEICRTCPLNSNNVEQNKFKDKVMLFLNNFLNFIYGVEVDEDAICTECGCQLIHKSTQTEVELKCPLEKW